ncbi:MAG TPA: GNAT family N-acetyltransferase [Blastocatellia bacterium]|nr:GNAT family N-acetyltransferase [Blastocatellia bacterium]
MQPLATIREDAFGASPWAIGATTTTVTMSLLDSRHEAEVLAFLEERPVHTFGMVGFIKTNGIVSPHNRGSFLACRDEVGHVLGVALIGHHILLEIRTHAAIEAFAKLAREFGGAHLVLAEQELVEAFWSYYADGGQSPRRFCRELLLEQRWPVEPREAVPGLRRATLDELELVVPVQAQCAFDESGIDPMQTDPEGFRQRCAQRIDLGKTWVLIEDGRLIFKAEVITETSLVSYLEGVWVDPQQRGKGHGSRCLSQLGTTLLRQSSSVCLLVNEKASSARAFYQKAGYRFISYYDTVFLNRRVH